jgi:hypothetical protein
MARCKVIAPIFVSAEGRTYTPYEDADLPDAKASDLERRGLVVVLDAAPAASAAAAAGPEEGSDGAPSGDGKPDLSALYATMTRDQLVQAAQVRGIDVPSKANKAQIVELLQGA